MSIIQSKFDDISKICFEPIAGAVVKVKKITRVDNIIIALGENGKIYTNGVSNQCYYLSTNKRTLAVLKGCAKLKILTAKAIAEHKAEEAAQAALSHNQWLAESILDRAKDIGLKLTAAQLKLLKGFVPAEAES